jgi:non-specific serine/threonine protein kinase
LQILAWISAEQGDAQRSATLLGAAERIWRDLGQNSLIFPDLEKYQRQCEQTITKVLSSKGFVEARDAGSAMSRQDALAYALNERPDRSAETKGVSGHLTKREWEVAALVAQGRTNKAIAEALVVSHRTAQGHVENILTKLGFNSRAQIAAWMAARQVSD